MIVGRTQGSEAWGGFYALFVIAIAVHAPIGVRNSMLEWTRWRGRSLDAASLVLAIALLRARAPRGGEQRSDETSPRLRDASAGYRAFLVHRISGLALALFLPLHFLTLWLALEVAESLDRFLAFADLPLVKAAEWGLRGAPRDTPRARNAAPGAEARSVTGSSRPRGSAGRLGIAVAAGLAFLAVA